MLRPVVREMEEHLPHGDALVDIGDEPVADAFQPPLHDVELLVPESPQFVDRRQRLILRSRDEVVLQKPVAPAHVRAEHVHEDRPESALTDDASRAPDFRTHTAGRIEDPASRPAVVSEEEPDLGGVHQPR